MPAEAQLAATQLCSAGAALNGVNLEFGQRKGVPGECGATLRCRDGPRIRSAIEPPGRYSVGVVYGFAARRDIGESRHIHLDKTIGGPKLLCPRHSGKPGTESLIDGNAR